MNGRTAKLIRKFCLVTHQITRVTKRIWNRILRNEKSHRRNAMVAHIQDMA